MKILLFIVTYKASYRVVKVIDEIPKKYFAKHNYKILISDDSSKDSTIEYMKILKRKNKKIILNFNKKNIGYGANIKRCINYAFKNNYDYAAMIHGDNQYSSKFLGQMFNDIIKKKAAAVTGSRMRKRKDALKGGMPLYKFLGNIFLTKIFNLFNQSKFSDCHTGYWVYNLGQIKQKWLKNFDNGFLFDLDMRQKLLKKKLKISEVSIPTRYGDERSSVHFNYAIRFFLKSIFS